MKKMNKAIVLHTTEDARDCVRKKLYRDALLFSTHSSVDVYLKEYHDIKCQCLSRFLTVDEIMRYKDMVSEKVDSILLALDSKITPSINKQFALKMRYFCPLYSYIGKQHFSIYVYFVEAINKIIDIYKLDNIAFYDYHFTTYLDATLDMHSMITRYFADIETQILKTYVNKKSKFIKLIRLVATTLIKFRQNPILTFKKILDKATGNNNRYRKFLDDRKTILLYEHLFELDFLRKDLADYNILYYKADYNNKCPEGFRFDEAEIKVNIDFHDFDFIENKKDPYVQTFLKDIEEDFTRNIAGYISGINFLKKINKRYPISLGIWGTSPIFKLKALIFEYLKSEGIKVVGGQHGCRCGDSYEPQFIDSDFKRCDYFISYGFTREDLDRLYQKNDLDCKIKPFGKVKLIKQFKSMKKIDILFPPAIITPFITGMMRSISHELTDGQQKIIEYLDSLRQLDIYIKPVKHAPSELCTISPVLRRLKNLKVVDTIDVIEFLERYEPRIAVIDFPTQPLFECLCLSNVEIFMMNDKLHPFDKNALELLKKRVHYSENAAHLISNLDLFLKGRLERKRDTAFYSHYIYKENAKFNILRFIASLLKKENADKMKIYGDVQDENTVSSIR